MADFNRLRLLFLRHLSKPAYNRSIYQAVASRRVCSILELGVGNGERAERMIEAASANVPVQEVRYTGVDLFEARETPVITLKTAYRLLQATGARVRLVPGDPLPALGRVANTLGPTDLTIVSHDVGGASLEQAWFYLPRILHPTSLVLKEALTAEGEVRLHEMPLAEVNRLASAVSRRKAA